MRLIDADEVIKFYKNMGKKFPELSDGVHFSISDIISNLDNFDALYGDEPDIDTVKNVHLGGKTAMTKYSDIEIQTAENLLKMGFKWITRNKTGRVFAHSEKPCKALDIWWPAGVTYWVCEEFVPIFQNVRFEDKEPTSLESIVHPQILDDAERAYLSAVIKPFRDRVEFISKVVMAYQGGYTDCYICIRFTDSSKDMPFPVFCETDMYKGMKLYEKYTLEELGL